VETLSNFALNFNLRRYIKEYATDSVLTQVVLPASGKMLLAASEAGPNNRSRFNLPSNRTISVYRFPRRALMPCPQLCMGIQPGARFLARSADALSATLYGHFT